MKKILFIEDRPARQSQFLNSEQIKELKELNNLEMPQEDKCSEWISDINKKNKEVDLSDYNLIIIHRSSLNQDGLKNLYSSCEKKKIDLILFSGGLSQITYQNEKFEILSINSKDFYSERLLPFIKKYIDNKTNSLPELIYGDRWEIALLLQYRLLKTKYELEEEGVVKIRLEDELNNLKKSCGLEELEEKVEDEIVNKKIDKLIAAI